MFRLAPVGLGLGLALLLDFPDFAVFGRLLIPAFLLFVLAFDRLGEPLPLGDVLGLALRHLLFPRRIEPRHLGLLGDVAGFLGPLRRPIRARLGQPGADLRLGAEELHEASQLGTATLDGPTDREVGLALFAAHPAPDPGEPGIGHQRREVALSRR